MIPKTRPKPPPGPIPFPDREDMWKGYPGSKRVKAKAVLAKHTPGGESHEQALHGEANGLPPLTS